MPNTAREVLTELQKLGKESFRKTYQRHGVTDEVYGVSTADLKTLQKKLKKNNALANELWASGVYDARILATMIADPKTMEPLMLDRWARDLDSYPIADAVGVLLAGTKNALQRTEAWRKSKYEYVSSAGWHALAALATKDTKNVSDEYLTSILEIIRKDIKRAPNYTRHTMNGALIAIGLRSPALQKLAIAVAREIGKVEVDHGKTACVTPDAESYIKKALSR